MERIITPYENQGLNEIHDRMCEVRARRGYSKDMMIWEIIVDLDKKLTEAEERLRKLP